MGTRVEVVVARVYLEFGFVIWFLERVLIEWMFCGGGGGGGCGF